MSGGSKNHGIPKPSSSGCMNCIYVEPSVVCSARRTLCDAWQVFLEVLFALSLSPCKFGSIGVSGAEQPELKRDVVTLIDDDVHALLYVHCFHMPIRTKPMEH